MSTTKDTPAGETTQSRSVDWDRELGGPISRLFQRSLTLGLAILLVGTGIELIQHRRIPTETTSLTGLPDGLIRLQGEAILALGLLVILATPAIGLAYLAGIFFRHNDRRYTLIAMVVLVIILSSIGVNNGTN